MASIVIQNKVIFQIIAVEFEKVVIIIVTVTVEMIKAKNHLIAIIITTIKREIHVGFTIKIKKDSIIITMKKIIMIIK